MSPESLLLAALGGLLSLLSGLILYRIRPRRTATSSECIAEWREIQKMCRSREDWAHAVIHADMFLDQALEHRKFAGKSMGERMVNAEKQFSKRDQIWAAHKMANALRKDTGVVMTKKKTKDALLAYQRALKDLEVL